MKMEIKPISILIGSITLFFSCASPGSDEAPKEEESVSKVWVSDLGNGSYKNPIIYADYSDPDVVRVREDYYMTSSSFNCIPGLPILHSKDLVNWKIVNYAIPMLTPSDNFDIPQHGNGVWAPAIRYHENEFYIYYGDPDSGIYMTKTNDPSGEWSAPVLVKSGKGWIDPCPLWDSDGKAYLVHAFAGSRSGLKSILLVHEMSADGTKLKDDGVLVFDGHENHTTIEGPKFYKRGDYYYIFAPAGGVQMGWQLALRSKNVLGPYESKIVLHQGNTDINGPHQGAWVNTSSDEDWFIHFQDKEAYGRVVHLQPMQWKNDWPLIGVDVNNDGIGEPVSKYKKPAFPQSFPVQTPQVNDEFNKPVKGLQWQWHANSDTRFGFPSGRLGYFRLNAIQLPVNSDNLWQAPNLLLQKFMAEEFTATARFEFFPSQIRDKTGLIVMGQDYAYVGLVQTEKGLQLIQNVCMAANSGNPEKNNQIINTSDTAFYLQIRVQKNANCIFQYSTDNKEFFSIGESFVAVPGRWIGAKIGFFCMAETSTNNSGYVNIDWFRVEE